MKAPELRSVAAGILAVLACFALLVSILGVWAGRTVLNTDRFTAAVDTSLSDPVVIDALSAWVTEQVEVAIQDSDIAGRIVPDEVEILAPLLEEVLIRFAAEETDQIVRSERVHQLVVNGTRRAHEAAMQVLEGERPEGRFVRVEDGRVDLNLLPVIGVVLERASQLEALSGRDLPELTRDMSVEYQNEALGEALGRDLPDDFGQLTIYERDAASDTSVVGTAQTALSLFRWAQVLLLLATVLFGARNRLRMGAWLAFGAVMVALIVRVIIRRVTEAVPAIITDASARDAAKVVIDNVVGNLDRTVTVLAAIAILLLVVLLAWGWLGNHDEQRMKLQSWVGGHADLVRAGGVICAVGVLLILGLSLFSFLVAAAIGIGLWTLPLAAPAPAGDEEAVTTPRDDGP
jgi:hypothetical protein